MLHVSIASTFLLVVACLVSPVLAQSAQSSAPLTTPDLYAGLSAAAAKSRFEHNLATLRSEQRAAMQLMRQQLQKILSENDLDQATRLLLEQTSERLTPTSDFPSCLQFVIQTQRQLSGPVRSTFDTLASQLADHWRAYQQCKRDYQTVAGQELAKRWPQLSLKDKRCELSDYLALADQRPAWLMHNSPVNTDDLVPSSAMLPVNQYLTQKRDLIQSAQAQLQSTISATIRSANEAANSGDVTDKQRAAAQTVSDILEAPYARGLRAVPLCQPTEQLPASVRIAVQTLLQQYCAQIKRITPAHKHLLETLTAQLESSQRDRLREFKFEEQMAIDIHLAKNTHLVQPSRVLANRSLRTNYYEDALLLELDHSRDVWRYRVEFQIDGVTRWIEGKQLITSAPNPQMSYQLSSVPTDGPGQVVNKLTDFSSGQVFAHGPAGWKPVTVVDESALGVVIRWQGPAEPIEFYYPRQHLRIVTVHQ